MLDPGIGAGLAMTRSCLKCPRTSEERSANYSERRERQIGEMQMLMRRKSMRAVRQDT